VTVLVQALSVTVCEGERILEGDDTSIRKQVVVPIPDFTADEDYDEGIDAHGCGDTEAFHWGSLLM
jgi:hypothetical protein